MKLVSFEVKTVLGRFVRLGALLETDGKVRILDLNAAYTAQLKEEGEPKARKLAEVIVPSNMRAFIEVGDRALDAAQGLVEQFDAYNDQYENIEDFPHGLRDARLMFNLSEVTLKAPLEPASFRDFFAFEQHVAVGYKLRNETIPEPWYKIPVYYKGNHRSFIGPDEKMHWPAYSRKLDYEPELGCVIGKSGRNLSPEQAHRHIFGYTIINDFSARDIQKHEMQCRLGPAKGKDFATGIGPYIVTKDEIPNLDDVGLRAFINGRLVSEDVFGNCHFSFEEMISHWSQDETIHAGDVIASGTVGSGCALENGHWLQPNDDIALEVDGLGTLKNHIVPAKTQTFLMDAFPGKTSKLAK